MGLIMLILIGTVPTAYALNRALPESQVETFIQTSLAASKVVETKAAGYNVLGDPRPAVTNYVTTHQIRRTLRSVYYDRLPGTPAMNPTRG
jgi:PiT family inorganic phosphate transporter